MKIHGLRSLAAAVLAVFLLAAGPLFADGDVAGAVVRLKGSAIAMQDAVPRVLKAGAKILRGDVISTGPGARLEIRMIDDAVMTLGEKTIFVVIDYTAKGAAPNAAMRLLQGAFSAVTGDMMKTASATFTVDTELATIGIRGTTFWGGTLDGVFQIALLDGKAITVETKAGRVVIDTVGTGTSLTAAGVAPTAPKAWSGEKIGRALATVAF